MNLQKSSSTSLLLIVAIVISVLLSTNASLRSIVNPDGICYLMSAEEIGRSNLHNAMKLCAQSHWPFFSLLIHSLVKFTHISYLTSAYIIDAVFSAISTLMFLLIVRSAGANKRTMIIAACVFLFAHEFNAIREYIVRDHGFWAFYLTSLWLFIRYLKTPNFLLANLWFLALTLATLFRIEGALFLLLLPFACMLQFEFNFVTRIKHVLQLYLPVFVFSSCIVLFLAFNHESNFTNLGRISEIINQLQNGFAIISQRIDTAKIQLAIYVLPKDSISQAGMVFTLMMIAWYLTSVIKNLTFGYAFLVAYAWLKRNTSWTHATRLAIISYLIINILITSCFLLEKFFLSKRYLIALSLLLMLWVPFAIEHLLQNRQELKNKILLLIASGLIISSGGGLFEFGYSKNYIQDAGRWLADNVPQNAKLYTNDYQLMYYSEHYKFDLYKNLKSYVSLNTLTDGKWQQYDYLAIRLTKKNRSKVATMLPQLHLNQLQSFKNTRGDEVLIYKVQGL